jgi:hypothetical protein
MILTEQSGDQYEETGASSQDRLQPREIQDKIPEAFLRQLSNNSSLQPKMHVL